MSRFNISGRRPGGSELIALNIDSPGADGLFGLHSTKPVNYEGAVGDGTLDLVGFDVEVVDPETLRFWLINQRPPVDENRDYLDASQIGANATIDVFELKRGEDRMVHIKTVVDPAIYSPNGIAALGDGSFVTSNDHSGKSKLIYPSFFFELETRPIQLTHLGSSSWLRKLNPSLIIRYIIFLAERVSAKAIRSCIRWR
jgi:hypothetical protein